MLKMSGGPSSVAPKKAAEKVLRKNFPVGMKVLLVDDDLTCLGLIEGMLLRCHYDVTACSLPTVALALLRQEKSDFDMVVTDVYMPDIDGFKLLEIVGLEMDLPVVMISTDTRPCLARSGLMHGACDFLIKPLKMEELKSLWKHVSAKAPNNVNDGQNISMRSLGRKRSDFNDDNDECDYVDSSLSKKPRVVWSLNLHQQFVKAVNFIGLDGAIPTRILEVMNVPGLSRAHVASHLQKYRSSLKKLNEVSHCETEATSPLSASTTTTMSHLPRQGPHTLAVLSQIPQELPAPLCSVPSMPVVNNLVALQAPIQAISPNTVGHGITFVQDQSMSPLVQSSSNYFALRESASNIRKSRIAQDDNVLDVILQRQPQPNFPVPIINAVSSSLEDSNQLVEYFHFQSDPSLINQEFNIGRSQPSYYIQAGKTFFPENLNTAGQSVMSSTNMWTDMSGILSNESLNISSQPQGNVTVASNPVLLSSTSSEFPTQQSTSFQPLHPHLMGGDFLAESNLLSSNQNSSLSSNLSITELSNLLSPLDIGSSSTEVIEELFNNEAFSGCFDDDTVLNNFPLTESISSSLMPCSNINNGGQMRNPIEDSDGQWNRLTAGVSGANIQVGSRIFDEISNEEQASNHGFVGSSIYTPESFGIVGMESPRNVSTELACSVPVYTPWSP